MSEAQTAAQVKSFYGDKVYQQRARAALPLLVRQAKSQRAITYGDLAEELDIELPLTLNYPLGSIGKTLAELSAKKAAPIPPINCLVVNKSDGLPGEGVDYFIAKEDLKAMSKRERRAVINGALQKVFAYPHWDEVLRDLQLPQAPMMAANLTKKAAERGFGGGESDEHKQLKAYVASHPELLGLGKNGAKGIEEFPLPSGDTVDVLFQRRGGWIAVEVKSHISADEDLARGIFQCVKYQAVLEAYLLSTGHEAAVRTTLVTSRTLSAKLIALKNQLGVEVVCIAEPDPIMPRV